jgi:hypothetical protein
VEAELGPEYPPGETSPAVSADVATVVVDG